MGIDTVMDTVLDFSFFQKIIIHIQQKNFRDNASTRKLVFQGTWIKYNPAPTVAFQPNF